MFLSIFLISFISAKPTFDANFDFAEGYTISSSGETYLSQGQSYQINFFVYNKSDGSSIDNSETNCTFYMANKTGDVIISNNSNYADGYWSYVIDGGNFSSLGEYDYGIYCSNYLNTAGGAYVNYFDVTTTGKSFTSGQSLVSMGVIIATISIMFLFMIFGFKLTESDNLYPIGFLFIIFSVFFSIYLLHQSFVFSNNILELSTFSGTTEVMYIATLWTLSGVAIISFALMLIAFIKELSNTVKKRKFGEDFNPITDAYE